MQQLPLTNNDEPVTEKEVNDWLDKIPNLSATPSRREAYRKAYNVENKIRLEKRKLQIENHPKRRHDD